MVFGNNESVINSAAIPHSRMHKRWVALSYHRVRWAVAAGITNIYHIAGKKNPADILSKHWDLPSVWDTMKPLLFWHLHGDQESEERKRGDVPIEDVKGKTSADDVKGKSDILSQPNETSDQSQSH